MMAGVLALVPCLPVVPWRYTEIDTNLGARFVMERYYYIHGTTDYIGNSLSWSTLTRKTQRKVQEFGTPSAVTAVVGAVGQMSGFGGAITGCATWQACKEHVNMRWTRYRTLAITSYCSIAAIVLGALMSVATSVFLWQEYQSDSSKKKKKKKKHDDSFLDLEPESKTLACNMTAFMLTFGAVMGYNLLLDSTLKMFQQSAYYPYAASNVGPYIGGFAAFLMFLSCIYTFNRAFKCCGYKMEDDEDESEHPFAHGENYGMPPGGGYGGYGHQGYGHQGW